MGQADDIREFGDVSILHIKHKGTVQNKYSYILSGQFMCILSLCMCACGGGGACTCALCVQNKKIRLLGPVIVRYNCQCDTT